MTEPVFVFGSNIKGVHGAGAALTAVREYGAIRGQGQGLQGNSYAIPTKETPWRTLSLKRIAWHVDNFIRFARHRHDLEFKVTAIGCGFAGFTPEQIAPMFKDAPSNCVLPDEFKKVLRIR